MNVLKIVALVHILMISFPIVCGRPTRSQKSKDLKGKHSSKKLHRIKSSRRDTGRFIAPYEVIHLVVPPASNKQRSMGDVGPRQAFLENSKRSLQLFESSEGHIVPEVECPKAEDGLSLFACPSPDRWGHYKCLDDHALCDNYADCPNGEDEHQTSCMFYKMVMNSIKVMMNTFIDLTRSV